jgi:hypothetical protein
MNKRLWAFALVFPLLFSLGAGKQLGSIKKRPETKSSKQVKEKENPKEDEEKKEEKKEDEKQEVKKEKVKQSNSTSESNKKSTNVSDNNNNQKKDEKKAISTPKENTSTNNSTPESHERILNIPVSKKKPKLYTPLPIKPPQKHHKPHEDSHKSKHCSGFSIIVGSYYLNLGPKRKLRVNVNVRNIYNKDGDAGDSKELSDEFYLELEDYLNTLYEPRYNQFHREYYFHFSFSNDYDYDRPHYGYDSPLYGPHHGERCSRHHDSCNHNSSRSYWQKAPGYCCESNYNRYYVDFYVQKGEDLFLSGDNFYKDGMLRSDWYKEWEKDSVLTEAVSDSKDICEDHDSMFEECINLFVLSELPEEEIERAQETPKHFLVVDDDSGLDYNLAELPEEEIERTHETPILFLAVDDDSGLDYYATELDYFVEWEFPMYFDALPSFDCCEGAYLDHIELVLYNSCGSKSKHDRSF